MRVSRFLDVVQRPALLVLGDQLVLKQLLKVLVGVAPDSARRDPMFLGDAVQLDVARNDLIHLRVEFS